ncbi:glycosyltransferase family 25 protein [Chitinibacter bivalviorum]|uniref:Glycosyltransferase family 25 protein n=1 Tax=Chitinibacter bivalviorum TaxID=2739434 RepID=A0A7H9BGX3_9NEIS|nr:glycosyltransferase family 25 protein [Chitinibacter bivalviorum]QLG87799.1 glycosyltransferase family 25 protein [Chitinibacter bivalviorum]
MTLSDLIDRIYIINLPERNDRKAQISAELNKHGMHWQDNKIICWPAIRPHDAADFPTLGAHGCFLSHLGALRDACQLSQGWVLILEDDAVLLPQLTAALPDLKHLMASDQADLIYLGCCEQQDQRCSDKTFQPSNNPIVGAHAYLVSRAFIDELLPYLQACLIRPAGHPLGGRLHFDGALSLFRQFNPDCRTWLANRNLVEQRFSRSDIQARWWYDQWPVVKQLAAWARQWKQFQRHVANKT